MEEIAKTGYWNGETAHLHHVHCKELSKWICEFLKKNWSANLPILDFGMGLGNYLKDLKDNGFNKLYGFEGNIPKKAVFLDNVYEEDFTKPIYFTYEGVVISLEVGEHIPKKGMNVYLDNITKHCSKYLITSWAVRGQPGFGHVNCLDNHEIIPLIEKRGFTYLKEESESARNVIKDNTWWFKNTILIFKKNDIK